jgi:hypothetical protein
MTIGDETAELGACPECDVLHRDAEALEKFTKTGRLDNSTLEAAATWWMRMYADALSSAGVRDEYPSMPAQALVALRRIAGSGELKGREELLETLPYLVYEARRQILNAFAPPLTSAEVETLFPSLKSLAAEASRATSVRERRKVVSEASREVKLIQAKAVLLSTPIRKRLQRLKDRLVRIRHA